MRYDRFLAVSLAALILGAGQDARSATPWEVVMLPCPAGARILLLVEEVPSELNIEVRPQPQDPRQPVDREGPNFKVVRGGTPRTLDLTSVIGSGDIRVRVWAIGKGESGSRLRGSIACGQTQAGIDERLRIFMLQRSGN